MKKTVEKTKGLNTAGFMDRRMSVKNNPSHVFVKGIHAMIFMVVIVL